MIRPNGGCFRATLLAAGIVICAAVPLHAEPTDNNGQSAVEQQTEAEPGKPVALTKPVALNKFTKRKRSAKVARVQKPRVIANGYRRKAIESDAASNVVPMADTEQAAMTESVSNANAQWPAPDTSVQPVAASPTAPQTGTPVSVASDQLNETDKSAAPIGDDAASQIASKMAAQVAQNPSQAAGVNVPTTATPAMSAMASADKPEVVGNDDSAWGQSSLIGKIFIAFGGLLTIASAARMFMA